MNDITPWGNRGDVEQWKTGVQDEVSALNDK